MGRGLSDIQKTILSLAASNRGMAGRKVDLYQAEIFQELCGWNPIRVLSERHYTGQHFSKVEVGERQYNGARATVSRAIRRLEERGLVIRVSGACSKWSGINLTAEGVKIASRKYGQDKGPVEIARPRAAQRKKFGTPSRMRPVERT
jgi:hypothetical protein